MASTLEKFTAFGVDAFGLERILRFWESIFMVLVAWPSIIPLILPNALPSALSAADTSLRHLRGHVNITRRWIRLFRFLDAFRTSYSLYAAPGAKGVETWLEVVGKSCLGMFGLLETATLPDVSGVAHLDFFGAKRSKELNRHAQVFWFTALYCSALVSGIRLIRLLAYKPVPQSGSCYGTGEEPSSNSNNDSTSSEKPAKQDKDEALKRDRENLKKTMQKRKEESAVWTREASNKAGGLVRQLLADMLDLLIPAWAVGWLEVDPGFVGLAMLGSTVISSMNVWARVVRDLEKKRA